MKKAAAGCFAAICVIALLVAILASIGRMRQEKLAETAPLTLEDLDRLSKALSKTEVPDGDALSSPKPNDETASKRPVSPAPLPRRLNAPATEELRRESFVHGKSKMEQVGSFIGNSPLGGIADAALVIAGVQEGASWTRGMTNLTLGNWAAARSYLSEYIRNTNQPVTQQQAYAYLAWLEDDPEVAARYMELACSDGQLCCLSFCASLARDTGSTELADHYRTQYEAKMRELDRKKPLEVRSGPDTP